MKPKRNNRIGEESGKPRKKAKPCQFTLLPEEIEQIEKQRSRYQRLFLEKSDKPADITKSEIVRAGIYALINQSDQQFFKNVESLEVMNKGRPAKQKEEEK